MAASKMWIAVVVIVVGTILATAQVQNRGNKVVSGTTTDESVSVLRDTFFNPGIRNWSLANPRLFEICLSLLLFLYAH
jgi:hypothetical protein